MTGISGSGRSTVFADVHPGCLRGGQGSGSDPPEPSDSYSEGPRNIGNISHPTTAASVRPDTPSFWKMDPRWALTVPSATNSSLLISRFVFPNMSDARTCISRAVRGGLRTGERNSLGGSIVHCYPEAEPRKH